MSMPPGIDVCCSLCVEQDFKFSDSELTCWGTGSHSHGPAAKKRWEMLPQQKGIKCGILWLEYLFAWFQNVPNITHFSGINIVVREPLDQRKFFLQKLTGRIFSGNSAWMYLKISGDQFVASKLSLFDCRMALSIELYSNVLTERSLLHCCDFM